MPTSWSKLVSQYGNVLAYVPRKRKNADISRVFNVMPKSERNHEIPNDFEILNGDHIIEYYPPHFSTEDEPEIGEILPGGRKDLKIVGSKKLPMLIRSSS